jgi:hypothetical protein
VYQRARFARVDLVRLQTIRQGEIIQAGHLNLPALTQAPSQNVDLFDYDPCRIELPMGVH